MIGVPIVHYLQTIWWFFRINKVEQPHRSRLLQLAKQVTSAIWDIDEHQLDADFTKDVAFGNLSTPRTRVGRLVQAAAIGFGGVELRGDRFYVVAKSWNWPTVMHELVKGTAELVCLHGLRDLSDTMYGELRTKPIKSNMKRGCCRQGPKCGGSFWQSCRTIAAWPRC